jgi:hypothetical protein
VGLYELYEVAGHTVTIMRDQHSVLFGAKRENFRVTNTGVQSEFRAR